MKSEASKLYNDRGSSVLIILVLVAAMSVILLANSTTLRWLKLEIQRVDQQQLKKVEGLK